MKKFLVAGKRTPFVKSRSEYAGFSALQLSTKIVQAMAEQAQPDFLLWGQVMPNPAINNLGRKITLEAGLKAEIPAASSMFACATSMFAAVQGASMIGSSGWSLGLVGGVETMSNVPVALHAPFAQRVIKVLMDNPDADSNALDPMGMEAFDLSISDWINLPVSRSIGNHTEKTARMFKITRHAQDSIACRSHANAVAAQKSGFFEDLILPFAGVKKDTIPDAEISLEKLSALEPAYDLSSSGTLTEGNSSIATDGAAALWVANEEGLDRLGEPPAIEIVDWQITAMEYGVEGIFMAPARAIPVLLNRHNLKFSDIALWEFHEAFAAQLLANIQALENTQYRRWKAGVMTDLGDFTLDCVNVNGGSLAIGHPSGATGARILSQAAKALRELEPGKLALVAVCADDGQGISVLLRRV